MSETLKFVIQAILFALVGFIIKSIIDSKSKKENVKVKKQAYTDQLTGRGNRYLFYSVIDKLIIKNKRFAVCFMDLDGFKQINDTMGHDAGDKLLISLANALDENLPKNASSYRLGGDEFSIIIENIKTTEDVTKVLDRLKEKFKTPIIIDGTAISLEYSLGIAMYPEDAANRKDLVMYADDAMYYIKEHGKNDYYFHNKSLRAKIENDNKMQEDLKKAFENNEFGIDLQPVINLKNTTKICFEALLYWKHPVLGKLPSTYFIKQADEIALTIKLDQFVLDRVCKEAIKCKKMGYSDIQFIVNISNRHTSKKDFMNKLCDILNENAVDDSEILIELNDGVEAKKIESYKLLFEKLKECGAKIIINNYQIKYENIKLLKDLDVDYIRLSSKYVSNEMTNGENIFDNLVELSKQLGYRIIINTVENEQELRKAIKNKADYVVGNILFKKMESDVVEEFLEQYKNYVNKIDGLITKLNA